MNSSTAARPFRLPTAPPSHSVRRPVAVEDSGPRSATEGSDQPLADNMAPPGNRKKQKLKLKQAARLAAGERHQPSDGVKSVDPPIQNGLSAHGPADLADSDGEEVEHDLAVNGEQPQRHPGELHYREPPLNAGKSRKKKRSKKDRAAFHTHIEESSTSLSTPSASIMRPPPPPPLGAHGSPPPTRKASKDPIWNTSTQEERENIKIFWLELGEEERRTLVKVEKDAVLKKMKEQQKHSCSCTVCGRKRTAIEEELEVLYDAYYEELEQYANSNQGSFENGTPIMPPPRLYQPRLRSLDRHAHLQGQHHPSRGRVHELPDEDDGLEEEYDEDDDEPYSEDELEDETTRTAPADFFAFGNSLTVKGTMLFLNYRLSFFLSFLHLQFVDACLDPTLFAAGDWTKC
jgi:Salt tolerance down-regulator